MVEEEEDWRTNLGCLTRQLVAMRENEPFVIRLLANKEAQWWRVRDLACLSGLELGEEAEFANELYVVWLPDPSSDGYVTIMFCDFKTCWSDMAVYNSDRIAQQIDQFRTNEPD